jgi:hypothetical protein
MHTGVIDKALTFHNVAAVPEGDESVINRARAGQGSGNYSDHKDCQRSE